MNLKENAMIQHDSDCAVHNGPALPPGPCNCGAQAKYERRWLAYLYQRGCTHLARRRIAFGTWLGRRFCQARTDATRALCLTCYRLLFGKREARDALRWWCRAKRAQLRAEAHRRQSALPADCELETLLRGHLQQLLDIDEDLEGREGFAFAAGAALAHQMRSRK